MYSNLRWSRPTRYRYTKPPPSGWLTLESRPDVTAVWTGNSTGGLQWRRDTSTTTVARLCPCLSVSRPCPLVRSPSVAGGPPPFSLSRRRVAFHLLDRSPLLMSRRHSIRKPSPTLAISRPAVCEPPNTLFTLADICHHSISI